MYRYLLAVVLVLLGAACSAGDLPAATPIPTPEVWKVQYSSEMRWLLPTLHECINYQQNVGITVSEYASPPERDYTADFIFHWGDIDPKEYDAYVLGMDHLSLVVNASNPLDSLTLSQVESILIGEITNWENLQVNGLGEIEAWVYPENSSLQSLIEERFKGIAANKLRALISLDAEIMQNQIQEEPGAIGFIPGMWIEDGMKIIRISTGLTSKSADIPMVVLVKQKPDEKQENWLKCIEESWAEEQGAD